MDILLDLDITLNPTILLDLDYLKSGDSLRSRHYSKNCVLFGHMASGSVSGGSWWSTISATEFTVANLWGTLSACKWLCWLCRLLNRQRAQLESFKLNLSGFHFFPNFCQLSTEVRPPVLKSFNLLKQFAAEEHTEEMRLALNLFESLWHACQVACKFACNLRLKL